MGKISKMKTPQLRMHKYLLELLSNNKNTYIQGKPTLCLSCDRTGCRLHMDPNATDHPKPCEWLRKQAKLPNGAEYAAALSKQRDIRVQVLSCPKYTNEIGWWLK